MKAGPHQVAKRIRDELAEEKMVLAHVERVLEGKLFSKTVDYPCFRPT